MKEAEEVLAALKGRGWHMATAESCTGGNIAHELTLVAGVSEAFNGGVVSYTNEAKKHLLGVSETTLKAHGAVSEETVREMVAGAARQFSAECAVATSGIAGPGGGTEEKPVGTVWMAILVPRPGGERDGAFPSAKGVSVADSQVITFCGHFSGNRAKIIEAATRKALQLLIDSIK